MSGRSSRRTTRQLRAAVFAAAVLALAGCATGGRYEAPDVAALAPASYQGAGPVSAAARADSATAASDRWWVQLQDPVLNELVDRAMSGNPDLASAEARVRQSRALAQAAGAAFLPELDLEAQMLRNKISRNSENLSLLPFNPPRTTFTDYKVGFDASWEIDLAGRVRHEVEAAVARFEGAQESRNDARVVVAAEVASAYVGYRLGRERSKIAMDNRAVFAETVRLVQLQKGAGLASELDLQRAQADELANDAILPAVETDWHVALYQLAALLGESREELTQRLAPDEPLPSLAATVPVGIPSDLLRRRPDIRRAERDLAAAKADVGVAVAEQFPRFALIGDAGLESVRIGDLTSAASRFWDLRPQLTLPIFTRGRLRHQVEASAAARDAAVATYRSDVLKAVADAESALVRLGTAEARATSYAAASRSLQGMLVLSQRRYQAGEAALTDVLDVQRSFNQLTDLSAQSAGQVLLEFVSLQKALGGGWQ